MTKYVVISVLLAGLFGGACFFLFYPINQFPKPSGPYGVGITQYHWIDERRQESNASDSQHPNRELMVYIFYPTNKHDHQEPYNNDQVAGYKGVLSYTSKLPAWMFSGLDFLKVNEQPNAPLAECKEKLPVVILSHGWGAPVHGWTWFCELLASHGYFVVGINHPYVAQVTRYPDGRAIETLVFKKAAERKQEGGEQRYRTWKETQVEICAQDISSVINKLEEHVAQNSMFWSKHIDLNSIGVIGGSFGGTTAMRACRKDPRIKSCLDMDGCLRGEDATTEYSKQSLIILGDASNQWVGKQGKIDLEAINVLCNRYQGTVNQMVIEKAGHGVFSDIPFYGQTTLFLRVFAHYSNFYQTAPNQEQISHAAIASILATLESQILGFFDKTLQQGKRQGTPPKQGPPQIVVTPENSLLDEPVEIVISNLPAHAHVTLEASINDKNNNAWLSRATFQADGKGVVNAAKQAPISGTYKGVDPMGLFWSMRPTIKNSTLPMLISLNLTPFELSVFSDNKLVTQKTFYRQYIASDVEKKEVREQGLVGTLFYPKGQKSPGIMIIPGSSGQLPTYVAQLLASHGYAVFEVRYFGAEGLPKNLSLIPLEYFEHAMHWLKKQPPVDGSKIALMGQSTGGELALLLAATFPGEMNAVIALSAPSFVLGSWTFKNKPLPFVSLSKNEMLEITREAHIAVPKGTIEHPVQELCQIYLYEIKTEKFKKFTKEAMIPVENIRCPLLILSGDEDTLWPCSLFGKNIMERLASHGSKIERKFINYLNAGNNLLLIPPAPSIDLPFQLLDGSWSIHGGTTEDNARAHKEAWQEILNFLKQILK